MRLHYDILLVFGLFQENEKGETHFHIAVNCVLQSLKTQIISRSYDEVAICFFNTVSYVFTTFSCM